MTNSRPVSDLQDYEKVLREIKEDRTMFLTEDGQVKYAILRMETYDKMQAYIRRISNQGEEKLSAKSCRSLAVELDAGINSMERGELSSHEETMKKIRKEILKNK